MAETRKHRAGGQHSNMKDIDYVEAYLRVFPQLTDVLS